MMGRVLGSKLVTILPGLDFGAKIQNRGSLPTKELIQRVAKKLPGHMSLHQEQKAYTHGEVIWPLD